MNIGSSAGNFLQTSPPFLPSNHLSPYLSPLADNNFQTKLEESDDGLLLNFRLDPIDEPVSSNKQMQNIIMGVSNQGENHPEYSHQCLLEPQSMPILPISEKNTEKNSPKNLTQSPLEPIIKFEVSDLHDKIRSLIEYLLEHINQSQEQLKENIYSILKNENDLLKVFYILMNKFKKLNKTKEQMIKYCMRKAFKFIADRMKKQKTSNRDVDNYMKQYFNKNRSNSNFSIPFKRNSIEKTMNGNFLKRVFSSEYFVDDYRDFLYSFKSIIETDNQQKIQYLTDIIQNSLLNNNLKKIEDIKRLPWTRQILSRTQQLAKQLLNYGGIQKDLLIEVQ